jgi:hypothetical protein
MIDNKYVHSFSQEVMLWKTQFFAYYFYGKHAAEASVGGLVVLWLGAERAESIAREIDCAR